MVLGYNQCWTGITFLDTTLIYVMEILYFLIQLGHVYLRICFVSDTIQKPLYHDELSVVSIWYQDGTDPLNDPSIQRSCHPPKYTQVSLSD